MKNRISHLLTPQEEAELYQSIATTNRILNKMLQTAQLSELSIGQNMGTEEGWLYVQRAYAAAEKFPKLVDPEELDIAEFKKDVDLMAFMLNARKEIKNAEERSHIITLLGGKDAIEAAHYIRQRAQSKRTVNLDYAAVSDELNRLFERRQGKAEETRRTNELIKKLQNPPQ